MSDATPPLDPHDERLDWERLARYVAGESPADEVRDVERWLGAHPADAEVLAALGQAISRVAAPPAVGPSAEIDVEAALRRVKARREQPQVVALPLAARANAHRPNAHQPTAPRANAARPGWRVGSLAAAAAALLAVGVARWQSERAAGPGAADAGRLVVTAVGQRDSVRLSDGTQVVLAPGSRLVVGAGYGDARRVVELEGAAWFVARHDNARPFTVRAAGAVVRDIGTAFTVRTTGERRVTVAVTEGSVALGASTTAARGDSGGVVLTAGDRGEVGDDGRVTASRGGLAEADTAWRQGRLVYREAPLDEVRADLRRWYGVDLQVDSPALARRHLTATFEAGERVERVLEVIALALDAQLERRGTVAILQPRGTARR